MMATHAYPGHQHQPLAEVLINPNVSNVPAFVPYIVTLSVEELDQLYATPNTSPMAKIWSSMGRDSWMRTWPAGTRFETRCRMVAHEATSLGLFPSLHEAIHCALPFIELRRSVQ